MLLFFISLAAAAEFSLSVVPARGKAALSVSGRTVISEQPAAFGFKWAGRPAAVVVHVRGSPGAELVCLHFSGHDGGPITGLPDMCVSQSLAASVGGTHSAEAEVSFAVSWVVDRPGCH